MGGRRRGERRGGRRRGEGREGEERAEGGRGGGGGGREGRTEGCFEARGAQKLKAIGYINSVSLPSVKAITGVYFQVLGISSYLPQKKVSASPDKEVEETQPQKEGVEPEKRVESDSATLRGEEKASPAEEMETSKEEDSDSDTKDEQTKVEEKMLEDVNPEERVMLKVGFWSQCSTTEYWDRVEGRRLVDGCDTEEVRQG